MGLHRTYGPVSRLIFVKEHYDHYEYDVYEVYEVYEKRTSESMQNTYELLYED